VGVVWGVPGARKKKKKKKKNFKRRKIQSSKPAPGSSDELSELVRTRAALSALEVLLDTAIIDLRTLSATMTRFTEANHRWAIFMEPHKNSK
jgi:hypothetical protein